ncbi:hypothetical protein D3C79_1063760 [compost metagenome]
MIAAVGQVRKQIGIQRYAQGEELLQQAGQQQQAAQHSAEPRGGRVDQQRRQAKKYRQQADPVGQALNLPTALE